MIIPPEIGTPCTHHINILYYTLLNGIKFKPHKCMYVLYYSRAAAVIYGQKLNRCVSICNSIGRKRSRPLDFKFLWFFSTTAFILFEHIVQLTVYYVTSQHKKVRFNNTVYNT